MTNRKYVEKDPGLERRFQPVLVEEPSMEEAQLILRGIRKRYEEHHQLTISDEAIVAAVDMSSRFVPDRSLPDKAIDLIDEAASRVRIRERGKPAHLKELKEEESKLRQEKEQALSSQQYDLAAEKRQQELKVEEDIKTMEDEWQARQEQDKPVVKKEDIAQVVACGPASRYADRQRGNRAPAHMEKTAQAHRRPGRGLDTISKS